MRPTFRIQGQRQTAEAFGELKKATARAALYRVLIRAAQPLDQAWRRRAPKLSHQLEHSGGIQKTSVAAKADALGRAHRAGLGDAERVEFVRGALRAGQKDRGFAEIVVGPGRNPQASQQEFGNAYAPAQPFFRPAFEETKDQAQRAVADGVTVELAKARAKAAAKVARVAAAARAGGRL